MFCSLRLSAVSQAHRENISFFGKKLISCEITFSETPKLVTKREFDEKNKIILFRLIFTVVSLNHHPKSISLMAFQFVRQLSTGRFNISSICHGNIGGLSAKFIGKYVLFEINAVLCRFIQFAWIFSHRYVYCHKTMERFRC